MCSDRTKKEKEHFIRFDFFIFFNRYDGGEGIEVKRKLCAIVLNWKAYLKRDY